MNIKLTAIAAAAAAAIAFAAPANAGTTGNAPGFANADLVQLAGGKRFKRFKRFRRHGRHFHGGWHYGGHWGHGFNYGYRNCGWLYKKAKWTGSRYWWGQYKACKYGY